MNNKANYLWLCPNLNSLLKCHFLLKSISDFKYCSTHLIDSNTNP